MNLFIRSLKNILPFTLRKKIRTTYQNYCLREHLRHEYIDRYEFFRCALVTLQFNGIQGDYAEFGCNGGNTFSMVHRLIVNYSYKLGSFHMYAFDSFEGLPASTMPEDMHPVWIEGHLATPLDEFHLICKSHKIPRKAYTVVPGFYNVSLTTETSVQKPENIRLAYIDCDLYSSTIDVLNYLIPKLQHGMILAFDDYYCYSSTMASGERLAIKKIFANQTKWKLLPYLQIGWHGMSFIVESTEGEILDSSIGSQSVSNEYVL